MLSSCLSCNSYSLFTLPFLTKQTRHGRNIISFYFFSFITGRAKCFIARAMCGVKHVTVAVLWSSCSLLCISNSDWATENEAGRSASVNGNEEPRWRDLSPIQFSCNCHYSPITHNKTPVHSTWGLLRVCVRPARVPVLTWVPSSVPLGTTSNIRSPPGPRGIQHQHANAFRFAH